MGRPDEWQVSGTLAYGLYQSTPEPRHPALNRFVEAGDSLELIARRCLEELRSPIRPLVSGRRGWYALVCQLAWEYPNAFTFELRPFCFAAPPSHSITFSWPMSGPAAREAFESAARHGPEGINGAYLWGPNRDARQMSIEAIDCLLRMTPASSSTSDADHGPEAPAMASKAPIPPTRGKGSKVPKQIYFEAFDLHVKAGWDQTAVAHKLSESHGRSVSQGEVSRWVRMVREWHEAGAPFTEG